MPAEGGGHYAGAAGWSQPIKWRENVRKRLADAINGWQVLPGFCHWLPAFRRGSLVAGQHCALY